MKTGAEMGISTEEHANLVLREEKGEVLIGIDPPVARRLFTDISVDRARELFGDPLYFERIVVSSVFFAGPLAVFVSFGLAVWAFGWWSAAIIPVSLTVWSLYWMQATLADQRLFGVFYFLVASIAICFSRGAYLPAQLWLAILASAFFFVRLTYASATTLLRCLVIRNKRAFELQLGKGVFLKEVNK